MASISSIRDGLKTALATISGLRVHDTVPSEVSPPAALIVPVNGTFDATMGRGSDDSVFLVRLAVSSAWTRTAQDQLDGYMAGSGAGSVKGAIVADQTLGGVVHYAHVARWENYGGVEIGDVLYFGVDFVIEVTASGS